MLTDVSCVTVAYISLSSYLLSVKGLVLLICQPMVCLVPGSIHVGWVKSDDKHSFALGYAYNKGAYSLWNYVVNWVKQCADMLCSHYRVIASNGLHESNARLL